MSLMRILISEKRIFKPIRQSLELLNNHEEVEIYGFENLEQLKEFEMKFDIVGEIIECLNHCEDYLNNRYERIINEEELTYKIKKLDKILTNSTEQLARYGKDQNEYAERINKLKYITPKIK